VCGRRSIDDMTLDSKCRRRGFESECRFFFSGLLNLLNF
jgi:hypothetical protein